MGGRGKDKLAVCVLFAYYTSCSTAPQSESPPQQKGGWLPLLTQVSICLLIISTTLHESLLSWILFPFSLTNVKTHDLGENADSLQAPRVNWASRTSRKTPPFVYDFVRSFTLHLYSCCTLKILGVSWGVSWECAIKCVQSALGISWGLFFCAVTVADDFELSSSVFNNPETQELCHLLLKFFIWLVISYDFMV